MKYSIAERRAMVDISNQVSIKQQCDMVSTHRSGFYYRPQGESALNLEIMRLIDAYFMEHSHSGVITLCAYLCLSQGHRINVKRVPPADAVDGPDGGISQHEAQRP